MEENKYKEAQESFSKLLTIMDELREKCPWDRKQTNESLRPQTLEEVYELSDAILKGEERELSKELGDVLLIPSNTLKADEDVFLDSGRMND